MYRVSQIENAASHAGLDPIAVRAGVGYMWCFHFGDRSTRRALSFVDRTRQWYPIVSFCALRGKQLPSVAFLGVSLSRSHCGQYDEGASSNFLIDVKMMKLQFSNVLIDRTDIAQLRNGWLVMRLEREFLTFTR